MRIRTNRPTFILLTVSALVGCGKSSHKNAESAPPPSDDRKVFSLAGIANTSFKSDCTLEDGSTDRADNETLTFAENSFENIWMNFDGADCDPAKKRTTYIKKLTNVEKEVTPDIAGWTSYVFTYESITATPHTVILTRLFNSGKVYGYTDWVINQPKEITGRKYQESSEAKQAKGAVRTNTTKIDGDTLLLARYVADKASTDKPFIFKRVK